jgi:NADH pyrophosphatase NudC (nudix superfamily)
MTTATNDQGAALDAGAVGGQGVEAAALTARRSTSGAAGPALADLDGAALLLQDQGQGAGRVERARSASTARPDSYCAHCGRRMSPGRHGRRLYCSNGCRQSAYKRRRRGRVERVTVEGVADGN